MLVLERAVLDPYAKPRYDANKLTRALILTVDFASD